MTAANEYGVDINFIIKGIRQGKLEHRKGSVWGNPYIRVLRRQLERYIAEERGADRLSHSKAQTKLRQIKKEAAQFKARLAALEVRRAELEQTMGK